VAIIGVSRKSFCCNDFFARTTDREQVNPHYCRQSAVGVDLIGHALVPQADVDAIERWRGTQRINGKIPPRSQAFMALLKLGMEASSKPAKERAA
jgi:hypothetical protein